MARRARKKEEDVEAYRHETDTRKNVVSVGLASYDTSTPKPKKYEYEHHLDPQLVWTGKAENTSFEVPTVSLHIKERIMPEMIVQFIVRIKISGYALVSSNYHIRIIKIDILAYDPQHTVSTGFMCIPRLK